MILTPIPRDELAAVLDRFGAGLGEALARASVPAHPQRPRPTAPPGPRPKAIAGPRSRWPVSFGMAVHPPGVRCRFNWDGAALNGETEAYVILHEIAHFVLAPPQRRNLVDFGLGPGPDTIDRDRAERAAALPPSAREEDEAAASLLGILWEAALGQPALASFLDQNWLEGLERSAAGHFAGVLTGLRRRGLLRRCRARSPESARRLPQSRSAVRRIR